jgi:hypothetical protein
LHLLALKLLLEDVREVLESSLAWEDKYALIFSEHCSDEVFRHFRAMNLDFQHSDPDASYDDDVRAFADAFTARMQQLNSRAGLWNIEKPENRPGQVSEGADAQPQMRMLRAGGRTLPTVLQPG